METLYVNDHGRFLPAGDEHLMQAGFEAARRAFRPGQKIKDAEEMERVLPALLAGKKSETLYVAFLTVQQEILAFEPMFTGTIDETPNYAREIVKRALDVNAKNLILVHNHPSGYSRPSPNDLNTTMATMLALKLFQMDLLDHVVVATDGITSIKEGMVKQMRQIQSKSAADTFKKLAAVMLATGDDDPNDSMLKVLMGGVHDRG
jgi:DNA repair protein RadC